MAAVSGERSRVSDSKQSAHDLRESRRAGEPSGERRRGLSVREQRGD